MNELIAVNDIYGVIEKKGKAIVTSLKIAEIFEKRHDDVLKSIRNLECSENFRLRNFAESSYKNSQNKKQPMYEITRDGFTMLAFGFSGSKASKFKEAYIQRFNEMEEFIENVTMAKIEFPEFTEAILGAHEEPKPYHFSNELDMINTIVLGMSSRKFKEANNIPKEVPSIRPYLTNFQIEAIRKLQRLDIGLIESGMEYQARKVKLSEKFRAFSIKLIAV